MKQCMDADNLHRRLKKIIGQVQAIDRMVDEDVPCEDIITQVNAAKSALHKVGQIILEGHLQHCVRDGIEQGDAEETIAKFAKAVERFSNIFYTFPLFRKRNSSSRITEINAGRLEAMFS